MKKIIMSLSVLAVAAAVVVGATTAFFSDTETSTGNTFTAGSIDLKVDSDCHYYNYVGSVEGADQNGYVDVGCGEVGQDGVGVGQWEESDLVAGVHKFFSFADIKPGDKGEDTISLHVYDNDAWGRILMSLGGNDDNSCTEPEKESDGTCGEGEEGELLAAMLPGFSMWLDQGETPGFQCNNPGDEESSGAACEADPTEGDNVWQEYEGSPWDLGADKNLSEVLIGAYERAKGDPDFDLLCRPDGHNEYGRCHGLAADGRMVGSVTYYFGLNWELPWSTGNEVQTDSLSGDITFEVEQHRNNPDPWSI